MAKAKSQKPNGAQLTAGHWANGKRIDYIKQEAKAREQHQQLNLFARLNRDNTAAGIRERIAEAKAHGWAIV